MSIAPLDKDGKAIPKNKRKEFLAQESETRDETIQRQLEEQAESKEKKEK